jgi:hypothetical protein
MEKILLLAYGPSLDKEAASKELDSLFQRQSYLSQKDFEMMISLPLPLVSGWVRAVLTIYIEDLPPRLASLDRRYSAALESEQMMARYGVPKSTCDHLRQVCLDPASQPLPPALLLTSALLLSLFSFRSTM